MHVSGLHLKLVQRCTGLDPLQGASRIHLSLEEVGQGDGREAPSNPSLAHHDQLGHLQSNSTSAALSDE